MSEPRRGTAKHQSSFMGSAERHDARPVRLPLLVQKSKQGSMREEMTRRYPGLRIPTGGQVEDGLAT